MYRWRWPLFLLCVLALVWGAGRAVAQSRMANGIVAVVNDVVITWNEVTNTLGPSLDLLDRQWANQPEVLQQKRLALQKERIEELIARQLILNDFTNAGYNLPESLIEDHVQERIRKDFGDRVTLTKTLQAEGVTYEAFKRRVRDSIIISYLQDQHVSRELIISPQKIETYYRDNLDKYKVGDEVKLRVLAINKPKDAPEAALQLAREIIGKIDSGVPFGEMAAVYSEGPQRDQPAEWVERSVLRKELVEAAFALKPGQRSDVIDTPTACFLLFVEDTRLSRTRPLSEVRDEIERLLLGQERDRLYKKWIDRLKTKAFVRYY